MLVRNTKRALQLLQVLSWIIFIGLCIEAGGFLVGSFFTLVQLSVVKKLWLWQVADISDLYRYSREHLFGMTLLMSIVTILKAFLFYLIVKILHDKKLSLFRPFTKRFGRFIFNASFLSLLIGLCSWLGDRYIGWLKLRGVGMPEASHLHLGGADVWLFMGIVLLVIAQMFKRGIEIQAENELTI